MKGTELVQLISKNDFLKKDFRGLYARDTFSQLNLLLAGNYILNTSVSTKQMGHWVVYCTSSSGDSSFFDPLGKGPSAYDIRFPSSARCMVIYNDKAVQHANSMSCGKFCLHFMFWKNQGLEMNEIVSLYSPDQSKNEMLVDDFVKRLSFAEV